MKKLHGIVGDAIRNEDDHVLGGPGVTNRLPKNTNAEEELVAVEQGDVGVLGFGPPATRSSENQQNHRQEP